MNVAFIDQNVFVASSSWSDIVDYCRSKLDDRTAVVVRLAGKAPQQKIRVSLGVDLLLNS